MAAQFQQLLPAAFLARALADSNVKLNNSLYSPFVVLWLLVAQRLHGGASLETAVLEFLQGLPSSFWPRPCKRIRDWRQHGKTPSSNTGAYNQARQSLPLSMVQQCSDHIFDQLIDHWGKKATEDEPQAFLLDGSTMRVAHTPKLRQSYPPGSNQYGESHWPYERKLCGIRRKRLSYQGVIALCELCTTQSSSPRFCWPSRGRFLLKPSRRRSKGSFTILPARSFPAPGSR